MKSCFSLLYLLLFSPFAFADIAGQAPGHMGNLVMLGGFLLIFYFMLIRPQAKRSKAHQSLIASIAKEDEVITSGGIVGKVIKVSEQFIVISVAEGIELKVQKQAITASLPKGTMKEI